MAVTTDRRLQDRATSRELKRHLNEAQLSMYNTLERFGWDLKFVRQMPGKASLVVLYDPDTRKYAILDADGVLEENPVFHQFRA